MFIIHKKRLKERTTIKINKENTKTDFGLNLLNLSIFILQLNSKTLRTNYIRIKIRNITLDDS